MSKPFYLTPEIETRIIDILDSHPADMTAVGDTIQYEYPELDRRQCGLAVMWVKKKKVKA